MLARTELARIANGAPPKPSPNRKAATRRRTARRGVAQQTVIQWGALAAVAVGGLAVAAWTQERGAERGARDLGERVRPGVYQEGAARSPVRLAQDERPVNELRPSKSGASPKDSDTNVPGAASREAQAERITRRTELRHITPRDLEDALAALSLRLVAVTELPEGDVATFEAAGPNAVRIYVARSSGKLSIQGPSTKIDAWQRLVETIDVPANTANETTKLVSLRHAVPEDVRKTISILQASVLYDGRATSAGATRRAAAIATPRGGAVSGVISAVLQPRTGDAAAAQPAAANQPAQPPAEASVDQPANADQPRADEPRQPVDPRTGQPLSDDQPDDQPGDQPPGDQTDADLDVQTLRGPVRVEYIEELDKLVVTGHPRDVEIVLRIIRQLEIETQMTRPVIEVYELQHVENQALSTFITTIYAQVLEARQGSVSITPLVQPNALLLIGRRENVDSVIELIKKLDQPINAELEFKTFRLKHASAFSAQRALREFYGDLVTFNQYVRTGMGVRVHVVVDYRTNTLFVQARPRDMLEIAEFIQKLDVAESPAVNQIRTIKLRNSLAQELAPIIQQAITGPAYQPPRITGQQGLGQQQFQQAQPGGQAGGGQGTGQLQEAQALQARSVMLQLLAQDENGQRIVTSDVLADVRITAEPRGNALIVSAPEGCMNLLVELIRQIDELPPAEAQIKVFPILYADAQILANTLSTLFAQPTQGGGGGQFGAGIQQQNFRIASADDEGGVLIPLRVAVEQRTNSVIVTGSPGDLAVVQALLVRLDDPDARERQTKVVRLKNSPAQNVADAINLYLQNQRTLQQGLGAQLIGTLEQFEREVIVVPEQVTNSLIVSATPRYFKEITELVDKLDERPPMVMIQVLIAEVVMRDTDEFGVELGVQDSILFDRSLNGLPGFAFNNAPLGNNTTVGGSNTVGSQSLSTFGVGRSNADLGFGGLVMSASSESISVLLRALQENRRLDVLSRPQVMALDNQPAFVQVGQQVPYITGIDNAGITGTTNFATDFVDVGIILTVIPRISPDGMVVMEIDATKSAVGPIEQGTPISIAPNGDVIRSPRIDTQRAQTTVMAASGQTVILGGLITKRKSIIHRQLPWIGDLPYVGRAFGFDSEQDERTELMIIMTPHVIRKESDNDLLKQVESARLSWCLADVYRIHGPGGPKGLGLGPGEEIPVYYPDEDPAAPEEMPAPQEMPKPGVGEPSVLGEPPAATTGPEHLTPPADAPPTPRTDPSAPIQPPRSLREAAPTPPTPPMLDDQARTLRYDAPRLGDERRASRPARYDDYGRDSRSPGEVQRLNWNR